MKFETISEAVSAENSVMSVSRLCKIAGVSRSGYYSRISGASGRAAREARDEKDFSEILKAYRYRGYAKGVNGIYMRLAHIGIRMNKKKIRRLMKKYGLICPIRDANPYRRMAKAMKTSNYADNIVKRHFTQGVRKVLLTDITYIPYNGEFCYLSTILDAYTHEILAYRLSQTLKVDFVLQTVDELIWKHGCTLDNETIIHSDQGCHYTSNAFIEKLKDENFVQSMSRRGNCWDNAPQESFFGHMKDEIMDKVKKCSEFEQVKAIIDDWIDYYNNDRYQQGLQMLSPREYYIFVAEGIDPLIDFRSKK